MRRIIPNNKTKIPYMKKTFTRIAFFLAVFFSSSSAFGQYVDFGYYVTSNCEPSELSLYDYSYQPAVSVFDYEWYMDGVLISTSQYPSNIPIQKGDHLLRLDLFNNAGHVYLGSSSYTIYIYGKVTDFNVSTGTQVCPGQLINFSVDNVSYANWNFGYNDYFTPSTSTDYYPSYTYKNPGVYTVTLITDNNCGVDTITKTITVASNALPSLKATDIMVQTGCVNDPVKFNVNGEFKTYFWEFGDGSTSNLQNPVYTYKTAVADDFLAKLTVTNNCNGTGSVNFPVSIQEGIQPDANFTYTSVLGQNNECLGAPIQFTPSGSGSYLWDFGDGTTSNERSPVHQFSQYNEFEVTLTVTNGCMNTATASNWIYLYGGGGYPPYPYFSFDMPSNGEMNYSDTLFLCPGQTAKFKNQTFGDPNISYSWEFGDGSTFYGYNAIHTYQNPGIYYVYLTATSVCGSSNSSMKYVLVDAGNAPKPELMTVPNVVCPGDKVYFFDNYFDPAYNYTYSILFGDGNSLNNITTLADASIQTLASHAYGSGGPYTYTFSVTNSCGNTASSSGLITVDNSATRKPFYFIDNTTEDSETRDPANWSVRRDITDYEVSVPVSWPNWNASYGNNFFLYFWYGGFNQYYEGYTRKPDGFVVFTAADLAGGVNVKAFIPVDPLEPLTIGIAGGYYCGGIPVFAEKPDVYGTLLQNSYMEIPSIPIIPAGNTDLASQSISIIIDPYMNWDGLCNAARIEKQWLREVEPGVFAMLRMFDGDGLNFECTYTNAPVFYTKSNYITGGNYYKNITSDTIQLSSYFGCTEYGDYRIVRPDNNTIQFIPINDPCSERLAFMTGTFQKFVENPNESLAACPGDKVEFRIVGGASYQWNFGDGNTSTQQYPVHSYATKGIYNARVIATNSCGRKDTLYTKVTIVDKTNKPVYFFTPENEKIAGDSTHFIIDYWGGFGIDNYTYLWDFGDGSTSTQKNAAHIYNKAGEYKVTLTATNGCGPVVKTQLITIYEKLRLCAANFDYSEDGSVWFMDRSAGNPTSWFWEFGDGSNSTEQNPIHDYSRTGSYMLTLTVFNQNTNCYASVTRKVNVGYSPCNADFDFVINANSGLTRFISKSEYASLYYWDFGDGEYSTEENPVHTYNKTGIYRVNLTIRDNQTGCKSNIIKDLFFIPAGENYIQSDFSYFTEADGLTVNFIDLSSSLAGNWYWTLGDGKIVKTRNPVHTYSKPGLYKVCLTVYDKTTNVSNSVCKEVAVGDIPCKIGSLFSYFITPGDLKAEFFNESKGNPDNYFWTFGDGTSSTLENPVKMYTKSGYYKVSLSVRNSSDECMDQYTSFILVGGADCRAGFVYRVEPDITTAHFKDDSKGSVDAYYWDFGDGTFSILPNPDHLYKSAGIYKVSQTVYNATSGCMDIFVQAIQVGETNCTADFDTYIDSLSYTGYFTTRIMGESTALFWSFGDGKFSTDENPVHIFPGPGVYSTGLNTYDVNSGCMDYYQEMILIGDLGVDCSADFIYRVNPVTSEVVFNNTSTGEIGEFLWNFGDDTENSDLENPVHTYAAPGYYYVCLNIKNADGTKNMGCKWVLVKANSTNECKANFIFNLDAETRTVKFADKSFGNISNYTWDFGDAMVESVSHLKNPEHTYDQIGYYVVKLKVENTVTGCISYDYKLVNVGEEQVLKAAFGYEAFEPDKKRAGYPVDLVSASSGDGSTVEWDFGDKQIKKESFTVMESTTGIVTHYYQNPNKYLVCLRVSDPASGQSSEYCSFVWTKYGVNVDEGTETGLNLSVYPNPFIDYTYIHYSLPKSQFVEIGLYDQLGRRIETLVKARNEAGNHEIIWETKSRATGIYHLQFITEDEIITRQLIITK